MRLLIIEDEEKIASFIKRGLKEEGYAVDVAVDGEQGDFLAASQDYDLIVLDLVLPKIDGISLLKKWREEKIATPVLILTAKDAVQHKVTGLDAGADDYLTKPFAFEEFLARIRALLRQRGAEAASKLRVGDLELDIISHEASRASRKILLTAKEYSLLEFLMQNEGKVVTRTMLSEHVWDIHFDAFTNVIDVYINHLRKKIDHGHDKKMIHTVRGRGYVLK